MGGSGESNPLLVSRRASLSSFLISEALGILLDWLSSLTDSIVVDFICGLAEKASNNSSVLDSDLSLADLASVNFDCTSVP